MNIDRNEPKTDKKYRIFCCQAQHKHFISIKIRLEWHRRRSKWIDKKNLIQTGIQIDVGETRIITKKKEIYWRDKNKYTHDRPPIIRHNNRSCHKINIEIELG